MSDNEAAEKFIEPYDMRVMVRGLYTSGLTDDMNPVERRKAALRLRDAFIAVYARLLDAAPSPSAETETEPWDHPYELASGGGNACIHCGFIGSYAHTEAFYRKWVWPALGHVPQIDGEDRSPQAEVGET